MGFFDLFKPKKQASQDLKRMHREIFPKGEKDISAGTNEVLHILNNKVDRATAEEIFTRATIMSRISEKFHLDHLRMHLSGYALQHFNEEQVKSFHGYLVTINSAAMLSHKTPADITRNGNKYMW